MTEELYFIKTNPTVAKINLYNKLCREEKQVINFLDDDKKVSLEIIKNKVKDSVENLNKEELLNIFSWLKAEYPSDKEEIKTQLFVNGLDIFYEIPTDDNIKRFQQILSDYEKISQRSFKYKFDSENFNQFLIYGIFFTGMEAKEKGEENIIAEYLRPNHKDLYSLAQNQFLSGNFINSENIYQYFTDLYDLTKFYKGSIIQLQG